MDRTREATPEGTCTMCAAHQNLQPLGAFSEECHHMKYGTQSHGKCSQCGRSLCATCFYYATRHTRAPVK